MIGMELEQLDCISYNIMCVCICVCVRVFVAVCAKKKKVHRHNVPDLDTNYTSLCFLPFFCASFNVSNN